MFKKVPFHTTLHYGSAGECSKVQQIPDGNVMTSVVETGTFSDMYKELGDPANFSLENQQMAGVPLKQVNSQLLDSASLDADTMAKVQDILTPKNEE